MGQRGCPETSVSIYHYTLRNFPEERISHLLRGGSLKSRNLHNTNHRPLNISTLSNNPDMSTLLRRRQIFSNCPINIWISIDKKRKKTMYVECATYRQKMYSSKSCRASPACIIQNVHKWMVQFQKLTRNLFLTLHGQNVHRQQRQLSQFLMC